MRIVLTVLARSGRIRNVKCFCDSIEEADKLNFIRLSSESRACNVYRLQAQTSLSSRLISMRKKRDLLSSRARIFVNIQWMSLPIARTIRRPFAF